MSNPSSLSEAIATAKPRWTVARAGVYTVVLGATGSAVWDVVAKPGVGRLSRGIVWLVGSLSHSFRDSPYSSAALDPSSVPSLILLVGVAGFVTGLATSGPGLLLFIRNRGARGVPRVRWIPWVMMAATAFVFLFMFAAISVVNEAVAIRRIFMANLAICSPVLAPQDHSILLARFAAMRTRDDYVAIDSTLQAVASTHRLTLRPEHW